MEAKPVHQTAWFGLHGLWGCLGKRGFWPALLLLTLSATCAAEAPVHVFLLAGQSNMARLDAEADFLPLVAGAFGRNRVVLIKSAEGGQPISRWYRHAASTGSTGDKTGDLYDKLLKAVRLQTRHRSIATVTFLWMQGEADAFRLRGAEYERDLLGLMTQLATDLGDVNLNFVIGRLSDHDRKRHAASYKRPGWQSHWQRIRMVQEGLAEASSRGRWVDTDDLNDGPSRQGEQLMNDLHYSAAGYRRFARRLATAAIELVRLAQATEVDSVVDSGANTSSH